MGGRVTGSSLGIDRNLALLINLKNTVIPDIGIGVCIGNNSIIGTIYNSIIGIIYNSIIRIIYNSVSGIIYNSIIGIIYNSIIGIDTVNYQYPLSVFYRLFWIFAYPVLV